MPIHPQHRAAPPFPANGRDARAPFSIALTLLLAAQPAWAGDILRGGAAPNVRQSDPSIGASVAAQQQARASQQDAMAKTAQSLNAVRAMQAQARSISSRNGANHAGNDPNNPGMMLPNVPNGLGPGALQLQGVPTGALNPVQSQPGGLTNVTIKQTAQQALLNWETFNVGRDTTLTFDQSAGGASVSQWIAFNRVNDPTGRPSQILGRINADGQVYIINQNGIIFGGAGQINVRTLVASSLPINDNLIQRGLLNNPDSQFLFSALPIAAGTKGTPAFTPPPSFLPDNRRGDVTVQAGALLLSPVSADGNGGRLMLVGPNVTNAGSLVAASGQVILAAGLQAGVDAHRGSDASLRGLDVYVGNAGTYAGTATNNGLIEIMRGSASISGKTVNNTGAIESSTSVALNGRIDLTANYDAVPNPGYDPANPSTGTPWLFQSTGAVNLGPGSLLRILPEIGSAEKAVGTEPALRSGINLQGKTIYLGPDANILAPNALVSFKAGNWFYDPGVTPPSSTFIASGGQVYLDRGATINVAGSTGVTAPLSQVILSLVLRSGELAPSPLQRTGLLRGPALTVDLRNTGVYNGRRWVGTPLADLTGYPGLVERTAGELTVAGGSVNISAGNSVVLQRGSSIDVSGGHIEYPGGTVRTSRIWADGHLVDIKAATPDRVYGGIFTGTTEEIHPRWGITNTYNLPLAPTGGHLEPTTLFGADAGSISLSAPSQALDGLLTGITSPGPRQLRATATTSAMPRAGSLSLSFSGEEVLRNVPVVNFPSPPDIVFGNRTQGAPGSFAVDAAGNPALISEERRRLVYLSPELTTTRGFLNLTIHNEGGNITVPNGVSLQGRPGGSFRFFGSKLGIFGNITAPGGTLDLNALNLTPYDIARIQALPETERRLPDPNPGRGLFTLGSGATLSTAGLRVDDRLSAPVPYTKPARIAGGSINIRGYSADLAPGSVIDASGGVIVTPYGERAYGNGGSILIAAGQDPILEGLVGGPLRLGSGLRGFSGAVGGSLAITAPLIRVGGSGSAPGAFRVSPNFFSQGGFTSVSLTGLGQRDANGELLPAVVIAPGTVIEPTALSLVAVLIPTLAMRVVNKPTGVRTAVSLGFLAPGVRDSISGSQTPLLRGGIRFGAGVVIRTDPLASVTLSGQTVEVLGSVFAPSGNITISGGNNSSTIFNNIDEALATVVIGSRSRLSTAGTTLLLPDAYGRRIGQVLPGGVISVSGNILAHSGAVLDVSGTRGFLDLHPATVRPLLSYSIPARSGLTEGPAMPAVERTAIDSSAGAISLGGGQFLFSDAMLLGRAGGPTATGGGLSVSSGRFYPPNTIFPETDSNLIVEQSGPVIPPAASTGPVGIGLPVPGAISRGYLPADTFARGGFDSLTLGGVVEFQGPVSLTGRGFLRVADGGVLFADNIVRLTAPYVALGKAFETPVRPENAVPPFATNFGPRYGPGQLIVRADQIDVGTLSLQNIGSASLSALRGDIRGNGTLQVAGDLTLRAAQIYPVTASAFNLIAYDYVAGGENRQGLITIQGAATRQLPLSAGGSLGVYAARIQQDGVLRAPFGSITLGWDGTGIAPRDPIAGTTRPLPLASNVSLGAGSITSVSAVDPLTGRGIPIPYGVSPDSLTWVDPRGVDITAGGLPEKKINIAGRNVLFAPGATIDVRGGGDLFAWRFVEGNGGPEDILGSDHSFAIVPGYESGVAPYAPFNPSTQATNLIGDSGPGYVNSHLVAGDRIFLKGSKTLRAGYYTLLPARYALLPGGVLVTPQTRLPTGTWELPDGASLVSGYQFNSLNSGREVPTLATQFELGSGDVIRARAQYETYLANTFLNEAAIRLNLNAPLLPRDSGSLAFQGTQSLILQGRVLSPSIAGGRGSRIDISSELNFAINRNGGNAAPGTVNLGSSLLGSWSAGSLIIGGRRSTDVNGNPLITANTSSITLDNAGIPLTAADLILASKGNITLAPGAALASSGSLTDAPDYLITGNGTLIRMSSDPGAEVMRSGVTASSASLTIGAGAPLSGGSITLDSSNATFLDPAAQLTASAYTLNSGRISLVLDQPGALNASPGLVLTGPAFANLQAAQSLTLRSYSSMDLYGSGQVGTTGLQRLALSAGEIRGINQGSHAINFTAGEIVLGNATGASSTVAAPPVTAGASTAGFNAGVIRLTSGELAFNNISQVLLNAGNGLIGEGTGRAGAQGSLTVNAPLVTGSAGSIRGLTAGGILTLAGAGSSVSGGPAPGLGATLNLSGRQTSVGTSVFLPSGSLGITSTSSNLNITGSLDVSGQARSFYDVTRFTDAGNIRLAATSGNVSLAPVSFVSVAAQAGGGNAGTLAVSNPLGIFTSGGTLLGTAGSSGTSGSFNLDTLALASTTALSQALTSAGLTQTQAIRVRTGNAVIDGTAAARSFTLAADAGSINVPGRIDASGATGGTIHLAANGDLVLTNGSVLTAAGQRFDNAGKGGRITLEAGTSRNGIIGTGTLDLQTGATIDLSIASNIAGSASTPGSSGWQGQFTGKLHLRAPQNAAGTDLFINAINASIPGASSITAEGYRLYDLTASGGAINTTVQNQIRIDGNTFLGTAGTTPANYTAITSRLLATNAGPASPLVLMPGAEVINRTGNLTLGTSGSTTLNDWDLSGYRFGVKSAPGVLTLRAAGDLVFNNTLSDGFTPFTPANNPPAANLQLWLGRLTAQNPLLPVNTQSYSYRLTAGSDLASSNFTSVQNAGTATAGSLMLGKAGTAQDARNNDVTGGNNALTSSVIPQRWQVIRTGSGDISISAAGNIQLLNQLATIYSAGTPVADRTVGGTFDPPLPGQPTSNVPGLGAPQQNPLYPSQYSMGGGNVSLGAVGNIEHLTRNAAGQLVADSSQQLPTNWLYRRGTIDPATDQFALGRVPNDVLSTTWWVDYSNFFQGVGALGGGNVALTAGGNVSNVDAVAPTNLRVTKGASANPLAANQTALELGGGDIMVRSGGNIDAGIYYVERGNGILNAGGSIVTNGTRSVLSPGSIAAGQSTAITELPTTLFAGRASFNVSARGDLLLGPVANPLLLPEGLGNSVWYKSFFSTFDPASSINLSSLGGNITIRTQAVRFGQSSGTADPLLYLWAANKQLLGTDTASRTKPWLRLNEISITDINRFRTVASLQPGTLNAAAYSGDINLSGRFNLSPSPNGTLALLATGAINALQPNGTVNVNGILTTWGTSTINVSDANPRDIPGPYNPLGYSNAQAQAVTTSQPLFFQGLDLLFAETGSTTGVIQTKQALHAPGLLHGNDTTPLRLYAGTGDISGLTLYSPKFSRVFAGRDLTDLSLYLQNVRAGDVSIVTSGRDIIPANASSPLRVLANRPANILNLGAGPLAGDIQIAGAGSLEVLAGGNLDLGTVAGNADGTGTGLSSIGNARNPYLGFEGASIIAGAGVGSSTGLGNSSLDFESFIAGYAKGSPGASYLTELSDQLDGRDFESLSGEEQNRIALEVLYLVLRDAGRSNAGTPAASGATGGYATGFAAIGTLFPQAGSGDILTRGRDIRTRSGGNITLFVPDGGLTLANTIIGNPLAPPGIVTESGGNISIFTNNDVNVGVGRIFTLRGGNQIIWSSMGNIAAGSAPKTVQSAPPTRVLIDPQSGTVQTDLAGLATGGGIGVLATVAGVKPGDVDLIAPVGVVDAGDAGIRSSGNLTIAATQVLNAGNIAVSGSSTGTPAAPVVSTPNVGGLSAAGNTAAAGNAAAHSAAAVNQSGAAPAQPLQSIFNVEVLGYGGGEGTAGSGSQEDEDEEERRRRAREAAEGNPPPIQ